MVKHVHVLLTVIQFLQDIFFEPFPGNVYSRNLYFTTAKPNMV